jgi:hypothetical protein
MEGRIADVDEGGIVVVGRPSDSAPGIESARASVSFEGANFVSVDSQKVRLEFPSGAILDLHSIAPPQ